MSFFVLAMMGLIVVFVFNPVEEEKPSSQISADSFYLPREEDNLTILLTGRAPRKKTRFFSHWSVWICWAAGFLLFCSRPKLRWCQTRICHRV